MIRWGDPVTPDAPTFDPENQTAAAQAQQFGYNNDFVGIIALPFGSPMKDNALLCVNHEFTNDDLMHPVFAGVADPRTVYSRSAESNTANPGGSNFWGQIVETSPEAENHAAKNFT